MDVAKVIQTIGLVGSSLPAFKALFEQVAQTFAETDQATLRRAYDEAMERAEQAHRDAQAL